VTYLGHASILIETSGARILTDPILRDRITFLQRTNPAVDAALYRDPDIVLISHLHYDHLDIRSLRMIPGQYRLVIPRGAAPVLEKQGFSGFQEISIGEQLSIAGVNIQATYADHSPSRHPLGPAADSLGYLIRGDMRVYYPGDTRLFPEMAAFAGENLDLALLPVWGWGPHRGRMHMGPKEAAQALKLLQPRLAVPIHWGTFIPWGLHRLKPAFCYYPPIEFAGFAKRIAPNVEVRILLPGERLTISDGS
jgi:L-ascorbate metabolism protein UlaG (beta-lactamase superfamily)